MQLVVCGVTMSLALQLTVMCGNTSLLGKQKHRRVRIVHMSRIHMLINHFTTIINIQ